MIPETSLPLRGTIFLDSGSIVFPAPPNKPEHILCSLALYNLIFHVNAFPVTSALQDGFTTGDLPRLPSSHSTACTGAIQSMGPSTAVPNVSVSRSTGFKSRRRLNHCSAGPAGVGINSDSKSGSPRSTVATPSSTFTQIETYYRRRAASFFTPILHFFMLVHGLHFISTFFSSTPRAFEFHIFFSFPNLHFLLNISTAATTLPPPRR